MDVEVLEIYVKPTDLPATQRIYPVKQAEERPEIGQVAAGPSNWTLKPEGRHNRSPRSSKSSMTTQVTTLSTGSYNGIHAGLGTPMPWMTRRFQKMNNGPQLPNVREEKEDNELGNEGKSRNKWGFTIVIVIWLLILAAIVVGAITGVVIINNSDNKEETAEPANKRKYFLASYEASMSLNNEVLTEKIKNENSPEFLQLSRDTCGKVNIIFELMDEYGGCDAVRYKNLTDLVYMDLIVKILYVIDLRIPPEVEDTNEEVLRFHAELTDRRKAMEGTIRDTFVRGVNNFVDLGNPSIELIPQTLIVTQDTDFCSPHRCYGGICNKFITNDINTGYSCTCPNTRTGKQCQVLL